MFSHPFKFSLWSLLLVSAGTAASFGQVSVSAKLPTPNLAAQERCVGVAVDVIAASENDRHLVCSAAKYALQLLGRCEISLRRPLHVEVTKELRHPFGRPVLGYFDIEDESVHVRSAENILALVRGTPFAELPQREFFRSVIVHEIIHGVVHQNSIRYTMSHAAGEYLAYALQIESFPSDARDKFLQSIPDGVHKDHLVFSDIMLSLDPFVFAAHAYEHFNASPNRCGHLHALLEGEVAFISTPSY